jgi:hypothetical protein
MSEFGKTRGDASWPRSGRYETTVAVERGIFKGVTND